MKDQWEKEIKKVAAQNLPIDMVKDYYAAKLEANKLREMQIQLEAKSKKPNKSGASIGRIPNVDNDNSSQENEEELNKIVKLLNMNMGVFS